MCSDHLFIIGSDQPQILFGGEVLMFADPWQCEGVSSGEITPNTDVISFLERKSTPCFISNHKIE